MYRIKLPDGSVVETDTPKEVVELLHAFAKQTTNSVSIPIDPHIRWEGFCNEIVGAKGVNMRKVLRAVQKASSPITRESIALSTKLQVESIHGIIGGIRKNAERAGFSMLDILEKKDSGSYIAGPFLLSNEVPES